MSPRSKRWFLVLLAGGTLFAAGTPAGNPKHPFAAKADSETGLLAAFDGKAAARAG